MNLNLKIFGAQLPVLANPTQPICAVDFRILSNFGHQKQQVFRQDGVKVKNSHKNTGAHVCMLWYSRFRRTHLLGDSGLVRTKS